jgi:hypothetical protein
LNANNRQLLKRLWLEGRCSDRPFPESDLLCGMPATVFYQKTGTGEFFCRCAYHASTTHLPASLYHEVTKEVFEVAQVMET